MKIHKQHIIDEHDCTHYADINCKCKPGECESTFRNNIKLGDNDLENFSKDQLAHIVYAINSEISRLEAPSLFQNISTLETLYAFRIMLYNAINKVKLK